MKPTIRTACRSGSISPRSSASPVQGVHDAMALISPRGGTAIGGMLEALKNTPEGAALLERILRREAARATDEPAQS